jgi:heat shock protein HslJ
MQVVSAAARGCGIALFIVSSVSCSNDTLTSPTSPAQLEGAWRLFQMTDSSGLHNEQLTAGRFSVTFTGSNLQVKADCNTCNGTTTLTGATLTVSGLACTRAACGSAPLDTRFTNLVDATQTVRINNRLLQLNSDRGELRFEK